MRNPAGHGGKKSADMEHSGPPPHLHSKARQALPLPGGAASIASCVFLMSVLAPALAEPVKLAAKADRQQIFIKEHIILTVRVQGMDTPPRPDLSAIPDCDVQFLDTRSENRSVAEFLNGRWSRRSFLGRSYTYRITPNKPGKFRAGPVRLKLPGRTLATPGPPVTVTGVEEQDLVTITVVPSREAVLVGEDFSVSLRIDIRALSGRFANTDPVLPREPPSLNVPFLDGNEIQGLSARDTVDLLRDMLLRPQSAAGFTINNYTIRSSVWDSFFDLGGPNAKRLAKFRLRKSRLTVDGKPRVRYELTVNYTPKKEGNYTFGPVEFKGKPVESVTRSGHASTRSVLAIGPACTVRVVPPPDKDRPESYAGAIGTNLTVTASVDAQTCRVGDPLVLTLSIAGDVSLDNIQAPSLGLIPDLTKHFRIYEDAVQSQVRDGTKTYAYTIRPVTAGTLEIPPIEMAFFDTGTREYRVARTQPIPIRANKAQDAGDIQIVGPATNRPPTRVSMDIDSLRVVAPVSFSSVGVVTEHIGLTRAHLAAIAAGPLVWVLFLAGAYCRVRLRKRAAARPRETALRDASRSLKSAIRQKDNAEALHLVCDALREYVGRRFGVSASGVTPADAAALLASNHVDADLGGRFNEIFERSFNATYSHRTDAARDAAAEAREALAVLKQIESGLRKPPAPHSLVVLLIAGGLFLSSPPPARADDMAEREFMWEQANAATASAQTPGDFAAAARLYRQLAESGVKNATVFHNLGTALLKAEKYDEAVSALLRAERYSGTTWDIERNLLIATAGGGDIQAVSLPWHRLILFWHYGLPCRTRLLVAICSFAALWLCLVLRRCGLKAMVDPAIVLAAVLLVLFGSSTATSLHQEAQADLRPGRLSIE